jgi:GNAT superfamily N-acetyltransferase
MAINFYSNAPCDPRQYLNLMKDSYGKIFDEEWFHWYNMEAPTGRSRIYFGVDSESGEMVSSLAFLPIRVTHEGTSYPGSTYVNAMTHPAYQGRGLNLKLLQSALADARRLGDKFSITFPAANRMSVKGMLKTGWEPICDIYYSALNRKPSETYSAARRIDSLDGRFDDLLEAFSARLEIGLFKDHEFMNWRVCERPDQDYEVYAVFDEEIPKGILVLKQYDEEKVRKIHIIEIISIDNAAIMDLLRLAEREAYLRNSDILNTWLSKDSIYYDLLTEFGFVASADKNTLMVQWHEEPMRLVGNHQLHFSLADNDVY